MPGKTAPRNTPGEKSGLDPAWIDEALVGLSTTPCGAPADRKDLPVVPGYEVLDELGRGGMGVVYQARQAGLNRLVALKMINREYAKSPQALERFRTEAEAVARLQHPHVVAVHAWGEHDGVPYFALEFCAGGSLNHHLRGRPQPPVEAARLVEKLARAVQAAHDRGIIHRDLKPANVLLQPAGDEPALNTPWGIPKVADFGLCRCFAADVQRTAEGAVAGSPMYMAPEQAEGRTHDIGPAADVWALGVILYELLTGRQPFRGHNTPSILYHVCHEEPPRPAEVRPEVPADLEAICLKCLRKPAGERYARAADLAAALRAWLAGRLPESIATAETLAPRAGDHGPSPAVPPGPAAPSGARRRPHLGWWVAAALLLVGLLGVGGWLSRPKPTSLPEPTTKPLTVKWRVTRYEPDGPEPKPPLRHVGDLGEQTFRVRFKDRIDVEAELSEPAYAYVIAFNPTDKAEEREDCLPKAEAGGTPTKRSRLVVPKRLRLDDAGLQAIAVVASRQPLPAYNEWRRNRPPLPWGLKPATSGVVWLSDGEEVHGRFDPGMARVAEEEERDQDVIQALARALRGMPGVDAVSVLGFAVDRPN